MQYSCSDVPCKFYVSHMQIAQHTRKIRCESSPPDYASYRVGHFKIICRLKFFEAGKMNIVALLLWTEESDSGLPIFRRKVRSSPSGWKEKMYVACISEVSVVTCRVKKRLFPHHWDSIYRIKQWKETTKIKHTSKGADSFCVMKDKHVSECRCNCTLKIE
jgi:hypothetical protein